MNNNNISEILLKKLLEIKAISLNIKEPFTWASGIKSPIYCDNRVTLGYPKVRKFIANSFVNLIKEKFDNNIEVIAGTATAGIPHATLIADILNLPMIYVRNKAKDHGKNKKIEGSLKNNQKVLVVEDLVSTGESVLNVCKSIIEEKCEILGIVSIFTYELKKSKDLFKNNNLKFYSLANYSDLIKLALNLNFISKEEIELLKNWKDNLNI